MKCHVPNPLCSLGASDLSDYDSIQVMFEVTLYLTYYKTKKEKNKNAS